MSDSEQLSNRKKLCALRQVAEYRLGFSFGLVVLGAFVAILEGVGLGFIYPIIEMSQSGNSANIDGPIMEVFVGAYQFFNLPFTIGYLILGVAGVMTVRYTLSFIVKWFSIVLAKQYERHLRAQAFDAALDAEVRYYDQEGTDNILNAVITETRYSGSVIEKGIKLIETAFLVGIYTVVMAYTSLPMTAIAIVSLGGITILLRFIIEPAVTVGSRVAEANERVQQAVQAGTQGIRDVKIFGIREETFDAFSESMSQYVDSEVDLKRNQAAIRNLFELSAALMIFVIIYVGFNFTTLALGELGIFLIAMFQLAPRVSTLNSIYYKVEGYLSHAVRTYNFLHDLNKYQEDSGDKPVNSVNSIEFDDVTFSYDNDKPILKSISFEVSKGEFIAFVGQSGAGKSTVVSLLARMYDPDSGDIRADNVSIDAYDIAEWREQIALVRQNPHIFTGTLRYNITIGNRDATRRDVERVCEIARVTEFIDDLPNGYESQLGDDGIRLSGGQRQRVALARALLKDAEFLLLDEATSDLDSTLERQVQSAIESMNGEYGIITIAHRLSTVKNADRIYTVEQGEIIESGSHTDLLSNEGAYTELYTAQSRG